MENSHSIKHVHRRLDTEQGGSIPEDGGLVYDRPMLRPAERRGLALRAEAGAAVSSLPGSESRLEWTWNEWAGVAEITCTLKIRTGFLYVIVAFVCGMPSFDTRPGDRVPFF